MKRQLSILLIIILVFTLFIGCAKKDVQEQVTVPAATDSVTPAPTENPSPTPADSVTPTPTPAENTTTAPAAPSSNTTTTTASGSKNNTSSGNSNSGADATSSATPAAGTGTATNTTKPAATKPAVTPTPAPTAAPQQPSPTIDPSKYVDGTYKAIYDYVDANGWKPVLNLTIADNKIAAVSFDYIKPDGSSKNADTAYASNMKAKSGVTPAEASAKLQQALIDTQNIAKVDAVAGATSSSKYFIALGTTILSKANTGDKTTAVLKMNATYKAAGVADSRGWKPEIAITYENGKISKVVYNEVNADGVKKRDDVQYNENYKAKTGLTIGSASDTLEQALVAKQSVNSVDGIAGATSLYTKFKEMSAQAIGKRTGYMDGAYKATYDYVDANGWKPFLDVVVKAGKIIETVFDYIKPDGSLKNDDATYANNMKAKTGITPAEATEKLEQALIATQDVNEVDSVAGATSSSKAFVAMGTPILEKAIVGDTTPIILIMNATYKAAGVADSRGWKPEIAITYENGKISKVVYNEVNADGVKKRDDVQYNENYKAKTGLTIGSASDTLEQALVAKQSVDSVDAIAGATSLYTKFKELAAQAIAKRK